jgi:hypothetical protein
MRVIKEIAIKIGVLCQNLMIFANQLLHIRPQITQGVQHRADFVT